ncbi:MAG: hypothetical protein ACRDV9_15240 [Acidimicrobiia bacterium]
MRRVQVPGAAWSVRAFLTLEEANDFHAHLVSACFEPTQVEEDHLGPGDEVISAGCWIVVYQVFS